jgi:hypothetical protein
MQIKIQKAALNRSKVEDIKNKGYNNEGEINQIVKS